MALKGGLGPAVGEEVWAEQDRDGAPEAARGGLGKLGDEGERPVRRDFR
jgi:hypothetical protein